MKKSILLLTVLTLLFSISSSLLAISPCEGIPPLCTREYNPHTCTYADYKVDGLNRCVARANLLNQLCTEGLEEIDATQISCEANTGNSSTSDFYETCSEPIRVCTREYRPAVCATAQAGPVWGPNRCNATATLLARLCEMGINEIKKSAITCKDVDYHDPDANNCLQPDSTFCTMEFNPSTCFFDGVKATGTNPCLAKKELKRKLCTLGITNFNTLDFSCSSIH